MGFGTFFIHGTNNSKFEQYSQNYYAKNQKDSVQTIAPTDNLQRPYSGKLDYEDGIGIFPDNNDRRTWRCEYVIDDTVKVDTVHKDVINDAKQFWERMRKDSKIIFTVTLIVGVCAIGGAIAAGIILGWPVALAISAFALIALGITSLSAYRMSQATKQNGHWKNNDTLQNAIQQRIKVGLQGFHYAYAKNLKGIIVTPQEVQDLWNREVQGHCHVFQKVTSSSTIRNFMESCPFSLAALDYAYPQTHPRYAYLKTKNEEFETVVRPIYSQIRSDTKRQEESVNAERHSYISMINQQCNAEVSVMKDARRQATRCHDLERVALDLARNMLRRPEAPSLSPNDRNYQHMMSEYESRLASYNASYNRLTEQIYRVDMQIGMIESDYNLRIASIEAKYEGKIAKINAEADLKLHDIRANEDTILVASMSAPIKQFLENYQHAVIQHVAEV